MKTVVRYTLRLIPLIAVIVATVGMAYPSRAADAPAITVSAIWRPGTQLTSVDSVTVNGTPDAGEDYRYVDADIYVRTSVTFWTAQLTCTVAASVAGQPIVFSGFAANSDPNTTLDDNGMVIWGPQWGFPFGSGDDFTAVVSPASALSATNAITFTASRLPGGTTTQGSPLGSNGITTSMLLATLRLRVKTVPPILAAGGGATLTCTSAFLNRDGASALGAVAVAYVAPGVVTISPGFKITGNVSLQGRAAKNNIGVKCVSPSHPSPGITTVTDTAGNFTIPNIRTNEQYTCEYFSNLTNPASTDDPDLYLGAQNFITINGASYKVLPIVLEGGNLDRTGNPSNLVGVGLNDVSSLDLALITGNLDKPLGALGANLGDINGDNVTTRVDLAILTGNYTNHDFINADHIIYGVARTMGTTAPDNRIWVGRDNAAAVTQLVTSTSRDFWPAISADGMKIAFIRLVGTKYSLFTLNSDGTGTAFQVTPATASYDSFAPSWSPDGTRIAFNCGTSVGWRLNSANLCVIDASGRNLQTIATNVKIYPPAWLDAQTLIYAGTSANSVCPDTLCKIPIQDASVANTAYAPAVKVSAANIPSGADMPSYTTYGGGLLVYRYSSSPTNRVLRAAQYTGGTVGAHTNLGTVTGTPFHVDVGYDTGSDGDADVATSTLIDYYALAREGWSIMYYDRNNTTGNGGIDFSNINFSGNTSTNDINWDQVPLVHHVDNVISNPTWDGVATTATDIHVQRNTFFWTP